MYIGKEGRKSPLLPWFEAKGGNGGAPTSFRGPKRGRFFAPAAIFLKSRLGSLKATSFHPPSREKKPSTPLRTNSARATRRTLVKKSPPDEAQNRKGQSP